MTITLDAIDCTGCGGEGTLDPAAPGCAPRDCSKCSGTGEQGWDLRRGGGLLGTLHRPSFEREDAEELAGKIEHLDDHDACGAIDFFGAWGRLPESLDR